MSFRKVLEERNKNTSDSFYFRIYVLVLGVYAGLRLVFAFLLKFPACHRLSEMSDQSFLQFFKWIYQVYSSCSALCPLSFLKFTFGKFCDCFQERYFVGRGLVEKTTDYMRFDFIFLKRLWCSVQLNNS